MCVCETASLERGEGGTETGIARSMRVFVCASYLSLG